MIKALFKILIFLSLIYASSIYSLNLTVLYKESKTGHYEKATIQELKLAEELFYQLFMGKFDNMASKWSVLGFDVKEVNNKSGNFLVIVEDPMHQTGRGFYVFSKSLPGNTVIQAPHSESDLNTGLLAMHLIKSGQFLSAAWNTLHRKVIDMAHSDDTYFMAYTKAFIKAKPLGHIIQIHGFDNQKREDAVAKIADQIISSGSKDPTEYVTWVSQCMKNNFTEKTKLYSKEVQELGGLTNVISKISFPGFLHIELNKDFRKKILQDNTTLTGYKNCLLQP